jgi:hypothetical protein
MVGGADAPGDPIVVVRQAFGCERRIFRWGHMNGTSSRIRLLPFLVGAAVGSLVGVFIGALFGAPLGDAIENVTEGTLDRVFGKRDEELRFELLLQ